MISKILSKLRALIYSVIASRTSNRMFYSPKKEQWDSTSSLTSPQMRRHERYGLPKSRKILKKNISSLVKFINLKTWIWQTRGKSTWNKQKNKRLASSTWKIPTFGWSNTFNIIAAKILNNFKGEMRSSSNWLSKWQRRYQRRPIHLLCQTCTAGPWQSSSVCARTRTRHSRQRTKSCSKSNRKTSKSWSLSFWMPWTWSWPTQSFRY